MPSSHQTALKTVKLRHRKCCTLLYSQRESQSVFCVATVCGSLDLYYYYIVPDDAVVFPQCVYVCVCGEIYEMKITFVIVDVCDVMVYVCPQHIIIYPWHQLN